MKDYEYKIDVYLTKEPDGQKTMKLMDAIKDALRSVLGEPKNGTMIIRSDRWIPFEDLVNSDDSFKPCPNCSEKKIKTGVSGNAFAPAISNPRCKGCNCWFRQEEKYSRKGFRVIVP